MSVQWLNPDTRRYETITDAPQPSSKAPSDEENDLQARARAKQSMQAQLAFRTGKGAEHRLEGHAEGDRHQPVARSLASKVMLKTLKEVGAETGAGSGESHGSAAANMRAQLQRIGVNGPAE